MAEAHVVCTQTYLGTHRVAIGTRAVTRWPVGDGGIKVRITEPTQGTELTAGEDYDVPKEDMQFWSPRPPA